MGKNRLKTLVDGLLGQTRKYPIKRDDSGKSARERAFQYFDMGLIPSEVSCLLPISVRTARRYYQDWKNLPTDFQHNYEILKKERRNPEFKNNIIRIMADYLGRSESEIKERLQQPWGLKQLMMGNQPDPGLERRQHELEARLKAALRLIIYMDYSGKSPNEIRKTIDGLSKDERN